jgi:predicted transcriptional regulator
LSGHPHKKDIWQKLTEEGNRRKILEASKEKPSNKTELSIATGLSRQTIHKHVSNLKKDGLIFQKGRKLFLADKGTSLLEKLKVLDLTFNLDMTQELSVPLQYSKNLYKLLKEKTRVQYLTKLGLSGDPGGFDRFFDSLIFGKVFPIEHYREIGVKKLLKKRAELAALLLCKAFKVFIFQERGRELELNQRERSEILTNIWNASTTLFKREGTKFAVVVTYDMDSAKSYIPEIMKEFYDVKNGKEGNS